MGLFDALSGRIEHFNSIAVPVLNSIFSKIKELLDENEKNLFTMSLVIAQRGIDLFFKPPKGLVIKDVKQYNHHHFEQLNAVFLIWIFYDFCNLGQFKEEELQSKLEHILPISEDELNHYLNQLKHGEQNPIGLDKLWNEISKIIDTMPKTPENYFVFAKEFSKILFKKN